jgi:glycosyltransferase involved in cell wall biosynthesis/SAM-dependent methyltransferase
MDGLMDEGMASMRKTTATALIDDGPSPGFVVRDHVTVGVVITTFNHARYLADAISSVLRQTRQADEIIVVDDGSTDDPASVVMKFQGVRIIRQENKGLAAARNTGLRACRTSHIVFLDADDMLLPAALETGLACAAKRPDCALVYGGHRHVGEDGQPSGDDRYYPIVGDAHLALLSENRIGMHATVLYRRERLIDVGEFDESLRRSEDYDLYLRITEKYPIDSHNAIVAAYRMHGQNMSANAVAQLQSTLNVLDRYEKRSVLDATKQVILRDSRATWRDYYVSAMLTAFRAQSAEPRSIETRLKCLAQAVRWSPRTVLRRVTNYVWVRIRKILPSTVVRWTERFRGLPESFPLGTVRFGDLRRVSPISRVFGFDRGTPVDRYYVERFLAENADDIQGRVLEVGDNTYTSRFGGTRVQRSDILHVDATNPRATIVGDLAQADALPEAVFECIVLTQVLHFLYDLRAGIATLYRALKPGGVLLLTMPGITQVDSGPSGSNLAWSVTGAAARRLLEEQFRPDAVTVEAHGNVFAATAFLYGLAIEELDRADLDADDANYPVIVAARAIKTMDP